MLPSSLCRLWQPDRAANAAPGDSSYTTAGGTILRTVADLGSGKPGSASRARQPDRPRSAAALPSQLEKSREGRLGGADRLLSIGHSQGTRAKAGTSRRRETTD